MTAPWTEVQSLHIEVAPQPGVDTSSSPPTRPATGDIGRGSLTSLHGDLSLDLACPGLDRWHQHSSLSPWDLFPLSAAFWVRAFDTQTQKCRLRRGLATSKWHETYY